MNLLIGNLNSLLVFDPLAVFFIIVILLIAIPALIYSIGYLHGKFSGKKIIGLQTLTVTFIVSMLLLVTTGNALLFLVFWEAMSLLSYFLVLTESENEESVSAASIYIIMTHIGTAFLIAAFALIY